MSKNNNEESLLQKLTKMGGLMYWKFFPLARRWEFSESFLKALSFPFGEGEAPFRKYVEAMDEPYRPGILDLLEPTDDFEDGTLFYAIQLRGKNRYHKCSYSLFTENGEEGVIGLVADVTSEQREMRRNKKIIEAMPDFIFIIDDQYYIRDVMKSEAVRLLHTKAELVGAHLQDIYSPQVTELFKEAIGNCIRKRSLQEISYPLRYEGVDYYFSLRMVPYETNEVLAFIHEITNRVHFSTGVITSRKKAEEENMLKSTFLMDLSHEIRTLLNLITLFSELMVPTNTQEERASYMKMVREGNLQLLELVEDVLDFSRIEQGKIKIHKVKFDLIELLRNLTLPCVRKNDKKIYLKWDVPEQSMVFADRGHVIQIVSNLLSNAKESMEEGDIIIRVREKENKVECAVIDHGKGVPPEKWDLIFERFYRVKEGVGGSGLGLPICKKLLHAMGGEISVQSEGNQGSAFLFTLPKYSEEPVPTLSTDVQDQTENNVYILTKEEGTFMLLNELLQGDFSVHWISDFDVLCTKCHRVLPDLIILNQEHSLKRTRDMLTEARSMGIWVPLIVTLPGEASYEEQAYAELLDSGATDLVVSPFTKFGLLKLVKRLVR